MKKLPLVLFSMINYLVSTSQQYDVQWIMGRSISVMDFRNTDSLKFYASPSPMPIFLTNANICDAHGNLLYFTNGVYIANSTGDTLTNGNGINPCPYTANYVGSGLNIRQAALFFPKPGDTSIYYLIHFANDTDNGQLPGTLYYTQIRDSALGYVIQKNIPFGKGMFRQGGMTACKHANGRDYWVVMGLDATNEYLKYLFTPDSVIGPFIQDVGPVYGGFFDNPCSKFSQDGSKYATGAIEGYVTLMDFDRCSGEFSNPQLIYNLACDTPNPCSGSVSLEFSPNGRFLYVSDVINLNQYDLWAANIQDSVEVYRADSTDLAQIDFIQVAPNGKMYGSTASGGVDSMHVVNYPDSLGHSCNFVRLGQPTLSLNSYNLPNMTNYNLGALIGSGCDTIRTGITQIAENKLLRVMPNPADKYLYVEMGMQGNYEFELLNENGQVVVVKETRQVDTFDTEHLAPGIYFLKIIDKYTNAEVATKKIIVEH